MPSRTLWWWVPHGLCHRGREVLPSRWERWMNITSLAGFVSHLHQRKWIFVFLVAPAHHNCGPYSTALRRYVVARILLRSILHLVCPEPRVALRYLNPPVPSRKFTRAESILLWRLRCHCACTCTTLHRINRPTNPYCAYCGAVEVLHHISFSCGEYNDYRLMSFTKLILAGRPRTTVENLGVLAGAEYQRTAF